MENKLKKRISKFFLIVVVFVGILSFLSFTNFLPVNNVSAASGGNEPPSAGGNWEYFYLSDGESSTLAICEWASGSMPCSGSAISNGHNNFDYYTAQGTSGSNSYVFNGIGGSNNGTVNITVPIANPSSGSYQEDFGSKYNITINGFKLAISQVPPADIPQDPAAWKAQEGSGYTSCGTPKNGTGTLGINVLSDVTLQNSDQNYTSASITIDLIDSAGKTVQTQQSSTGQISSSVNSSGSTSQVQSAGLTTVFKDVSYGCYTIKSPDLSASPVAVTVYTTTAVSGVVPANLSGTLNSTGEANVASANSGQSGSSGGSSFDTTCADSGGPFSWFICSAIDFTRDVEGDLINNVVVPLLTTQTINFNASSTCSASESSQQCNQDQLSSTIYKVWSSFRIFGDIVLVIAILAAVFAETIGGGQIEAYSVKKLLPKILAAAILINLSIYIVAGLEDVFNIFGKGLLSLIDAPFLGLAHVTISGGVGLIASVGIGGLVLVGAVGEGIIGVLLFVVGSFLLAALGVVITIMFRQALLVLLLLISPIAFALYCLPNTERYFRQWWDLLIKTLAVYPIVMALIAMSNIAYVVVNSFNITPTILAQLMGIMAAVAPLFVIPFAFKLSGGAIGGVYSGVSNLRDRVRQPINNARQANRNTRMERARTNNLYRGENRFARRASTIVQGAMLAPRAGLNPRRMRGRFEAVKSATTSANAARAGESQAAVAVLSNDDMLNASLHGNGTEADARAYLSNLGQTGRELDQNVAAITQARREMGRDAYNDAAVVANAGTGTGYGGGPGEMLEAINKVAGADRARAARLMAGARSQAERARRVDLYGSGFATSADQMTQLYNGHTNAAQVNIVMTDEGLMTKSAGEVGSSRNNAVNNMIPAMQRRVLAAQNAVADAVNNPTVADAGGRVGQTKLLYAQRQQKQALAAIANTLDVASQLAPENAVDLADGLMSRPATRYELRTVQNAQGLAVNTQVPITETLTQIMEHYRPDPEFQQMRREWQAGYQQGQQPPLGPLGGPQPPLGPQPPAPGQQFGPQGPI